LTAAGAFEVSNVVLEVDDLSPETVAFVGQFSETFTQSVDVGDGSESVDGIDEAGVAFTLSSTVGAHPYRVRRPLARSAHAARTGHRIQMMGA
jgi:hypothetical protein